MMGSDLNSSNYLTLKFQMRGNHLAEGGIGLEPFLDALETHAGELMPTLVNGNRKRKYSRAAFEKARIESTDSLGAMVYLERPPSPEIQLEVELWRNPSPTQSRFRLTVSPLSFFEEPERAVERSRRLIALAQAWASLYPVTYGVAHGEADIELSKYWRVDYDDDTLRQTPHQWIQAVFWLNVLGKELVDGLGRSRVLSTPAHLLEELPNGNVLLVTRPTVADHASEEARYAQARALVHLRPDLSLEDVLRTLRERSTALVPVEPRFDPDVAPLFLRVLDRFNIGELPWRTAELNARPPPAPDEWLPANAALPSDVPDLNAAIAQYEDLAENLVIILHSEVPSVFEQTPESLTDADYRFWLEKFPEFYERSTVDAKVVPAVGAYLGEVLVRWLGGRWVPRQDLFEAQVVIGDRAWLPFLRARRSMQSQQSLLDYSLTQFFRAAERHRAEAGA